jgi:hypothetical protein
MPRILRAAALLAAAVAQSMGPLQSDTTALTVGDGGCVDAPGDSNAICTDAGVLPDAAACSSACDALQCCSAMTWHGPPTGAWAGHCVLRKDGVWAPQVNAADHTAANKTGGWVPYTVPWGPATKGYTSRVKTFWFGANTSGVDSAAQSALEGAFDVAGFGWQTGHTGGGVGRGEAWQTAATTHLRDALEESGNPNGTVIFQYRQVQVALRLFAACALAAADPANDAFWLHDVKTGALCTAGQPWGTSDPYWNFTDPGAVAWWLGAVVGSLTSDASLTAGGGAVFFDEVDQGTCGYRAGSCDFGQFDAAALQASSNAMLASMVAALNAASIVPILSLDNRILTSGTGLPGAAPPCALPEDEVLVSLAGKTWARFYENWPGSFWVPGGPDLDAAMVANAILEGQAGVSTVLHTGGACPAPPRTVIRPGPLGGDIEFAIASYLVVQSAGTTLSISNDWYDESFCWRPDFDVDFGLPEGPAVRTGSHSWTRAYSRSNATVDLSAGRSGRVYLLA